MSECWCGGDKGSLRTDIVCPKHDHVPAMTDLTPEAALAAALPDDLAYWEDAIHNGMQDKAALATAILAALRANGYTIVPER